MKIDLVNLIYFGLFNYIEVAAILLKLMVFLILPQGIVVNYVLFVIKHNLFSTRLRLDPFSYFKLVAHYL